ncbi:TRAP transporter small permease subunit [Novosphingobium flavum]|uniref:TRAP transporter small permease protein n=1 Tax=Novosphingobium aerophilum TaxID=2839843 RepID=A0A7X1F736_9SPHN|nr:TRAP transporter small permease subunit [Novosphingobium aerophilum]MBC2651570.1 TRAP transporter small permease subunit [Novosphingobium aerophilum]MBC2661517.1 TRAP transporter small permease subunit [Novosphingobium aerophilum]
MDHSQPEAPEASGPDGPTGASPGGIPPAGWLRLVYGLGGCGLLGATAADAIAVAGRHAGFHLLGSIELVQAAAVLLAGSAMLIATVQGEHASVHMVTERLARPTAARLARLAALISGLVFLAVAAGSAWVAGDLWSGFERTELLHIPIRWLRAAWIGFALLIALTFLRRAIRAGGLDGHRGDHRR